MMWMRIAVLVSVSQRAEHRSALQEQKQEY
ncbi:MAG: hypothetical protein QOE83_2603 [Actinomycetota bacterium]|jgi:hypothetical protein|nr:hypothetical protein [Actinomycetota bacterium]